MNKQRRKALAEARNLIEQAQFRIDEARDIVENAANEEREYFDNMPESLQGGEKGDVADANATALEDTTTTLDTLVEDMIEFNDTCLEMLDALGEVA